MDKASELRAHYHNARFFNGRTGNINTRGVDTVVTLIESFYLVPYIDGPCGSKTIAGVFLARLERVGQLTHFYK